MSAPTAERNTGEIPNGAEVALPSHGAETVLGRAAITGEVAGDYEPTSHEDAEAFFADFLGDRLGVDSTGFAVTPEGAKVRLSRVTAAEELVHVEFPEADERLGATGLLVDAQRIEPGNPYLKGSGGALVKAATTSRMEDGTLAVDRLYDEKNWQYALGKTADAIAAIGASPVPGHADAQQKSYELSAALRTRHSELSL